jgi:prepilin-type N-terminal cleavage/methylation domain-containing protein
MERRKRQSGLSLVEVLIGMLILAVVSSQALAMLQSQLTTYHSQKRVLDTQEDSRLVADVILVDIRMAGFMIPPIAGISSVDGGNLNADRLCVSEWSQMDPDALEDASGRFSGTGLDNPLGAGDSTVDLTAGEMDIDDDGNDDYADDMGIIISDGTNSHCARITNVAGSTLTFTPASNVALPTAGTTAVPAIVYEINNTNDLLRNNLLLTNQVDDLQIQYGVDNDGDGLLGAGEFWLDTLDGSDHSAIMQVRLSVLTRTSSEDTQLTGAGRQRVANRDPGAADDFRRRLVTVAAAPRNLL